MVSFGTTQWHDSRWTQFLTVSTIRRIRHVTILVPQGRISKLSGPIDVSILPGISRRISVLLTKQSKLCCCIARRRLSCVLSNEPQLFADQSKLLTHKSTVLTNKPELQPDVTQLFAHISKLLANFPTLFSVANLRSIEPGIFPNFSFIFSHKSVLSNLSQLFTHVSSILPNQPILFPIQSILFSNFSILLANLSQLFTNISQLYSRHTILLSDQSQLLTQLAPLLPNLTVLLSIVPEIFTDLSKLLSNFPLLRWQSPIHSGQPTILPNQPEIFAHIPELLAKLAAALAEWQQQLHGQLANIFALGDLLAQHVLLFPRKSEVLSDKPGVHTHLAALFTLESCLFPDGTGLQPLESGQPNLLADQSVVRG